MESSNNSNNVIWLGQYEFLTTLGTALGHGCRPSATRRADNHDLGPFRGLSKIHIALSNHAIVGPTLLGPMNPCLSVRPSVRLSVCLSATKVMILPTIGFLRFCIQSCSLMSGEK